MIRFLSACVIALLFSADAQAQDPAAYRVLRAPEPPKIDGVLDDAAWAQVPPMPTGQWASYNPNRGDPMPQEYRTEVRVAYDDRNIYFAFHCFDHEPEKIRTNVTKRDSAFNDDWLAISLDSAGTGQAAYHLFTNPSGSQMDALNTSASGEQFDADMVWYSAAQTTSDGYVIEVQIPLQTLRFSGGDDVRMGLVLFRKVSRIGVSYAWPELPPGQWVFDRPSRLAFSNLKPRRLVELLPSVTYNIGQARESADRWAAADDKYNFGLNGKFGITSGITLDGTINPDFSQVESDAFQVEVNQRFPVFFSEKRPFFMEGMGLFNLAGTGGDGNMQTAVHTRRIVNPTWGTKLTGTLPDAEVEGLSNEVAAKQGPIVFLTVPFRAQSENLNNLRQALEPGQLLVDCTVPLAAAVSGKATRSLGVWQGSAAQQAEEMVPDGVEVVAALHTVSAPTLSNLAADLDEDVLLCGDRKASKARVAELVEAIPGLRAVNAGQLEMARIVEQLTPLLISINARYKTHAGIRITGLSEAPHWL